MGLLDNRWDFCEIGCQTTWLVFGGWGGLSLEVLGLTVMLVRTRCCCFGIVLLTSY